MSLRTNVAAQPLLLDTDIGTDIDDAYALVYAALAPEFDLRAVTVVNNGVTLRARIARQLLIRMGRQEVPVVLGAAESLTPGENRGWLGHEGQGITFLDEVGAVPGSLSDGSMAAYRIARCADEAYREGRPLCVCTIGAMTNLALALQRYPDSTRRIGQVVAMAADFNGFGAQNAGHEHNIACDPVAAQCVLQSGLPITLVGLNVTKQTTMTRADVDALDALGGPLAADLVGMHRVWLDFVERDGTPMHDGLALAYLVDPSLLTSTEAIVTVKTEEPDLGAITYTHPSDALDSAQTPARVAVSVDAPRFQAHFLARIHQAIRP